MSSPPIPTPNHPKPIKSFASIILKEPPSCIEFWPADPRYFVVGTYVLESGKVEVAGEQVRTGSLVLMRLVDGKITRLFTTSLPHAVLDLHFCQTHPPFFGVATSTGCVSLYSLNPNSSSSIMHSATYQIGETSILVLSLDWQPDRSKAWQVAVSLSNGEVVIFDCEARAERVVKKKAHEVEAWCVVWSRDGTKLWSGGDDSMICGNELYKDRNDDDVDGFEVVNLCSDRKIHGAGVTAILPIALGNEMGGKILLTGSYDEFIRVLEPPAHGGRFKVLAEKRLGGGVWRLKLMGTVDAGVMGEIKFTVLASCMHAGARIVEVVCSAEGEWDVGVMAKFEEHQSMNYGCDALAVKTEDGKRSWMCVSTSFYDKKLCVWNFEVD